MNDTVRRARYAATGNTHTAEWLILWLTIFLPPLLLLALDHSVATLIRFYPDDAFYYLQVAWNALHHGRISFDGDNTTTGFHPLQMLLATFIFLFTDKENALIVLFIFNALAIASVLTLLIRKFGANSTTFIAALVLTLPAFTLYLWTSSGLESALLLICCALFANAWLSGAALTRWSIGASFKLGICAGLVLLARLDMALPLSIFGGAFLLRSAAAKAFAALAAAIGGAVLIIAPYLLWMLLAQGSILPVSGIAKQARPRWPLLDIWRALSGNHIIGAIVLLLPALICLLTLFIAARRRDSAANYVSLTALSGLLYTAYLLFIAHEPFRWYLAYPIFTAMVSIIWLSKIYAGALTAKLRLPHLLVVGALIGAANYATLNAFSKLETTSYGLLRMTRKLAELVPANARLATHDAGVVGYFSSFSVVNLDGLINSLDNWRNYLKERHYTAYFQKEQVDFLLVRETSSKESFIRAIPTAAIDANNAYYRLEAGSFGNEILYKIDIAAAPQQDAERR